MDISNVSKLITGASQGNPPMPGVPPTVASVGADVGTDFGAAGVYVQGEQAAEPESFTVDKERVSQMWSAHEERVESFRQMVETLLGKQAERQGLAEGWSLQDIEITPEMRAEAEEMLEEGGYFSVDETATRILDFAVALTGGDPSKIESMREAVQLGFDQAESKFGEMPEISHETLAAVMNGFDEWAAEGSASAITLLNK
jgi:hypothetical protein